MTLTPITDTDNDNDNDTDTDTDTDTNTDCVATMSTTASSSGGLIRREYQPIVAAAVQTIRFRDGKITSDDITNLQRRLKVKNRQSVRRWLEVYYTFTQTPTELPD